MTLANYNVVLYQQLDGAWVAEVPAIGGCHALMDTREAALEELNRVFRLIAEEHAERGQTTRPHPNGVRAPALARGATR